MRRAAIALCLASLAACGGGPAPAPPHSTSPPRQTSTVTTPPSPAPLEPEALARDIVARLARSDFDGVVATFDAKMKSAVSKDKLESVWSGVVAASGAYEAITAASEKRLPASIVIVVTTHFARGDYEVTVAVHMPSRAVEGLFIRPKRSFDSPPYADAHAFTEIEVVVGSGAWALPGTVSVPVAAANAKVPGIVLVHGSGPQDRDETIGGAKPFRDLAWGLASRGVAVLRYEKRTRAHGRAMEPMLADLTTKEESEDDAVLAVTALRAVAAVDGSRTFVLGHSLGGMLAPRIAAKIPDLAGVVLLAAAARPLEDLILEQHTYLLGLAPTDAGKKQLELVKKQVATVRDPALGAATPSSDLPLGISAKYWLDLRAYDPAAAAKALRKPLLILQGQRDFQVTIDDYNRFKSVIGPRADVKMVLYPGLNHLFCAAPPGATTPTSVPADYELPAHVDVAVVEDIANWTRATKTAPGKK